MLLFYKSRVVSILHIYLQILYNATQRLPKVVKNSTIMYNIANPRQFGSTHTNIQGNKVILYNMKPFLVNIPEFQTFKVITKMNPVQSCTIP